MPNFITAILLKVTSKINMVPTPQVVFITFHQWHGQRRNPTLFWSLMSFFNSFTTTTYLRAQHNPGQIGLFVRMQSYYWVTSAVSRTVQSFRFSCLTIIIFDSKTVGVCDLEKKKERKKKGNSVSCGCFFFWYNRRKSLLWRSAGSEALMLVKAFLLRTIDTLSSSTRHCGASTYLGCDLAARGYSKYHLSRYLRNLLFSPVNGRMNVQLNIAASGQFLLRETPRWHDFAAVEGAYRLISHSRTEMIFGLRCPSSIPDDWLWSRRTCYVKPAAAAAEGLSTDWDKNKKQQHCFMVHPDKNHLHYFFWKNSNTHLWALSEFPRNGKRPIVHPSHCKLKQAVLKMKWDVLPCDCSVFVPFSVEATTQHWSKQGDQTALLQTEG